MKEIIKKPDGSVKVISRNKGEARTKQAFKDATNINKIMKKYHNDMRILPPPGQGVYGDFANAMDYLEARQRIVKAQGAFESLSSDIRKRFANDPAQLLAFLDDKKNHDEAVKLGLVDPPPPPPPPAEVK